MSQQQEQQSSSGWGGWGSWLSTTVDNVMTSVTDTTNKIGSSIQDTYMDLTAAPATPPTPTQENNTTNAAPQQQGDAAATTTIQAPEEKSLIDEAEETFNQLLGSVVQGSKKLAEAEEVKFVSSIANNLAQQTKEATNKLITQISDGSIVDTSKQTFSSWTNKAMALITGEQQSNTSATDLDIQFQELFEQNKGNDSLNYLNGMAKQFEQLAANIGPEKAEAMKELIELLKKELENGKFDMTVALQGAEAAEATAAGKEIVKLTQTSTELAANIESSITELVTSSTDAKEATKHGLLFIDKAKVDGYRLFCKLVLLVVRHFVESAVDIGSKKAYAIPARFVPDNVTPDQDKKKLAEQTVAMLTSYLLLVIKQIKQVSVYVNESTTKVVNIVKQKQGISAEDVNALEAKQSATVVDAEVKCTAALEYMHEAQASFVSILQSAFLVGE